MSLELHRLSFRKLVSMLSTSETSAESVFTHFINRAEQFSSLNAFTQLSANSRPANSGPLFGAPIAVKDNIDVDGFYTTGGTPALQNFKVRSDAPVVEKLRVAGASFLGKTNLHELSFGITSINEFSGAVKNPHDPTLFAGGSSGGSAAAVAAGLAPIALGTDTGGSCRIPAALCGVFGYRPSVGRYGNEGVIPLSTTRDTIGVIAREIDDIVFMDEIVSDDSSSLEPPEEVVLGVPDEQSLEPLDDAVRLAFENALIELTNAGFAFRRFSLNEVTALTRKVTRAQIAYEAPRGIANWLLRHNSNISAETVFGQVAGEYERNFLLSMLENRAGTDGEYSALCEVDAPALNTAMNSLFTENRFRAILQPTVAHVARPIADGEFMTLNGERAPVFPAFTRLTDPASCAGLACLSMPVDANGACVGVELQTMCGDDSALFSIAKKICEILEVSAAVAEPELEWLDD